MPCKKIIKINNENYIIVGVIKIFHIIGLVQGGRKITNIIKENINIIDINKINENIVAFSSKSTCNKAEDKLYFYNIIEKKIMNEIKNYSFITSKNCLYLMNLNKELFHIDNILLCICMENSSNGILLVEPLLRDYQEVYCKFHKTDFEVNCFCQINKYIKESINNIEKAINKETNYFLVGRFNEEKRIGVIELYELIYDEEGTHIKINFIISVGYNYFDHFESINYIIQSKNLRNILISCLDGNNYFFRFNGKDIFK